MQLGDTDTTVREGTEQAVYVSTVVLYGGYRKAGNSSSHAGQPLPHDLAVVKLQPVDNVVMAVKVSRQCRYGGQGK